VNACRNIDNIGIFFEREREVGQFAKKEIRFIGGAYSRVTRSRFSIVLTGIIQS
jgi:hypothetical protein